jgi:hypothetical protein
MDILTHTLSGVAIGTVVSSFSSRGFLDKASILLFSGFAGALPDFDAISLWSGFDSTIGSFFNLPLYGKDIYSGKLWYSHHAFLHSALAAILIAGVIGSFFYLVDRKREGLSDNSMFDVVGKRKLLLIGFILGFLMHLIEDMPTPASSWGGIAFFWPLKTYIGGSGDIWWWNNYDIFLIVVGVIILNLSLLIIAYSVPFELKKYTTVVFLIGFIVAMIQIKSRDCDFAYSGNTSHYQALEKESKRIQKDILGDKLYSVMESLDNKLMIYF